MKCRRKFRKKMLRIDRDILNIDQVICSNIDLIDFETVTRALVAQNLLSYSRNLVEHIAVKLYGEGRDIIVGLQTIKPAMEYIKRDNRYQFLRSFHGFLQESESHYTPENEGAERLVLKYFQYYLLIKQNGIIEHNMIKIIGKTYRKCKGECV